MSRKQKKVMEVNPLEARAMSEETIESEPSVQSMRQYMDQQFETINRRFAQLEQANIGSTEGNSNTHGNTEQATSTQYTQINSQEPICVMSTGSSVDQFEGNYPSTPMLNRLIIEASTGAQSHEKHEKNRIV
ncbi:17486_t:CDS:2, partial [Gigaspora rosea]